MTTTIAASANTTVAASLNAHTVDLVKLSIANGAVKASDIPALIREIHAALRGAYDMSGAAAPAAAVLAAGTAADVQDASADAVEAERYVSIYKDPMDAVTYEQVHCLIDGVGRKMLKRYVREKYGFEWNEYLEYFDLPSDYPSVAPKYSKSKSVEAKALGLGSTVTKVPKALRAVGSASKPAGQTPSARRGRPRNVQKSGRLSARQDSAAA